MENVRHVLLILESREMVNSVNQINATKDKRFYQMEHAKTVSSIQEDRTLKMKIHLKTI